MSIYALKNHSIHPVWIFSGFPRLSSTTDWRTPNFGSFAAFSHSCAEFCAFHIAHCASRFAVSALDLLRHHSGSTGLIAARALIPCVFDTCASHGPSVRYPRISHFMSASSRTRLPVVTAALITWSQSRRLRPFWPLVTQVSCQGHHPKPAGRY